MGLGSRSAAALHEARIADLKEAHAAEVRALNKVIEALAEQIEYLRVTLGRPYVAQQSPTPGLAWPSFGLDDLPAEVIPSLHMSEEEEDLIAMEDAGLITSEGLQAALANIATQ